MKAILAAILAAVLVAPTANASPEDPYGDDYEAIAISPTSLVGGYGSSGTQDAAVHIALTQCATNSGAPDCTIAQAVHHGCVTYVYNTTGQWAGGRGSSPDAALADAQGRLPAADHAAPGTYCST